MNKQKHDSIYYLEKAPISKAIAHMSIPMILGMVVSIICNITDAYFIGMMNSTPMMAGVTLAMPFTAILLMAFGNIFGIGGGTYIARLLGENDIEGSKKASSVNFYFSLLTGLLVAIIGLLLISPILQMLGAGGDTWEYTREYLMVFVLSAPIIITNFMLIQTVRGEGASKESMIGMVIAVVVNIALDPLFIFTFGWGIAGAAWATVLGNLCSLIYYIWFLKKHSKVQSVAIQDCKPTLNMLANILKIGISAFLLDGFLLVSSVMFNNYSMLYGESVVAGFGIAQRTVQLADLIGMGLYMGVLPLLAYTYSAGNYIRLKEIIRKTTIYLVAITGGITLSLFLFRIQLLQLFSIDAEVITIGSYILIALLASTLFACFAGMYSSIFQAFGKGIQANTMSIMRGVVIIPIIILGNKWFELDGVIWSITASDALACVIGFILYCGLGYKKGMLQTVAVETKDGKTSVL